VQCSVKSENARKPPEVIFKMTNERFNKKMIDLTRLIPADHFRTVESFEMRKAKSEVNVEIELKDNFIQKLNFIVPWDGKLYAYARYTGGLLDFCREQNLNEDTINTIYMQDWDDKFTIVIEGKDSESEISFYVTDDDMKDLLEKCCRIPEQKSRS
jgi:hypothetical protein